MPKLTKSSYCRAPNGQLISPKLYERIMSAKPHLEKANAERLCRSDAASRIIQDGLPVCEVTAFKYVRLLNLSWHHQQPYRAKVNREMLAREVPKLLQKGLHIYEIAPVLNCSKDTIGRFLREAELIPDGKRYTAPGSSKRGVNLLMRKLTEKQPLHIGFKRSSKNNK